VIQTSARLLRLLSLFQAQRYWSGDSLSERLDVTARTLRRDVDRLRSLGYPVHSTSGRAGGYQLGSGANVPPLLLDDDEAIAVALGLRTAASGTISGIEEASVRALAKLQQLLPARLRRRVSALHSAIQPFAFSGPAANAAVLSALAAACRDLVCVCFRYKGRESQSAIRHVEPHRLVFLDRRWYLAAWDLQRADWRSFRVDRIETVPLSGARFNPRRPPEGDFAAYVSRSVSGGAYTHQAEIVLHASAESVRDRVPPSAGFLEPLGPDTCLLRTGSHSLDMLVIFLGLIGADFEIRNPPELISHVRTIASRLSRSLAG
jgi:predicted DNA-binding transcriptional regulator YafY